MDYTLNCNGRLLSLETPQVMGILNVTPDSFYADSRKQLEADIAEAVALLTGSLALCDCRSKLSVFYLYEYKTNNNNKLDQ